ncbi:hypothetical protein MG293_020185 [Ovis ammon polii]|uniref:Uncharacterized protein n=1 Tax=Ovis ammon polii TaxID=230172 RepID=A0AAD4TN17_OVIAM|nr:hypothetical protein MG293_020185 [Ovis ammon polii]
MGRCERGPGELPHQPTGSRRKCNKNGSFVDLPSQQLQLIQDQKRIKPQSAVLYVQLAIQGKKRRTFFLQFAIAPAGKEFIDKIALATECRTIPVLLSLMMELIQVRGQSRFWNNGEDDGNEDDYSVGKKLMNTREKPALKLLHWFSGNQCRPAAYLFRSQ